MRIKQRRIGLRARLTGLTACAVTLMLTVGILTLIGVVENSLKHTTDAAALKSAHDVALLTSGGNIPNPIPVSGPGAIVQIIDDQHRVRGGSAGADRIVPILRSEELGGRNSEVRMTLNGSRLGDSGWWRVVAVPTGLVTDPLTVVVAVPAVSASDSLRVVRTSLWLALPLAVAGVAALTWFVAGRALQPVEAVRQAAASISAAHSQERLPVSGTDEITRLTLTLNEMLDRIANASRRQHEFVANVAHELRTPLTSARTHLEVAAHIGDPTMALESVQDIERLSGIVDDLLLLARADEGRLVTEAAPIDVLELARVVAQEQHDDRISVSSGAVFAVADPSHTRRVLTNLVANAARHARTKVHVSAKELATKTVITVTDDGPGIAPADRERALERFVRLDDARARQEGGSGLGLSITAELMRVNGGTLLLSDGQNDVGLTVILTLPAIEADSPAMS